MNTYLIRFTTNGIDKTEYVLTINVVVAMTRHDFTDIARIITGIAIQPQTIEVFQQVYPQTGEPDE